MSVYAVVRRLISSAMIVSVHAVVSVTSNGTNTQSEEVIMSRYLVFKRMRLLRKQQEMCA